MNGNFSLGEQSGIIAIPGTWEAEVYSRHIEGPGTYTKSVVIPSDWSDQTVHIQFGAVSYHAQVTVNDVFVGEHVGLWTNFSFDITSMMQVGETNIIRVTVYKPGETYPMREALAGFLPDVATTFGGMWRDVQLVAFSGAVFSDIWIQTDSENGTVSIKGQTHNAQGYTLTIRVLNSKASVCSEWSLTLDDENFDTTLQIKQYSYWQPKNPSLYTLVCMLNSPGGEKKAQITRKFGFRTLTHDGEQLLLNNQPAFYEVCLIGVGIQKSCVLLPMKQPFAMNFGECVNLATIWLSYVYMCHRLCIFRLLMKKGCYCG